MSSLSLFLTLLSFAAGKTLVFFDSPLKEKRPMIQGGENADPGEFAHQISLRESSYHVCGGSLLSESWALTAAHCVSYPWMPRMYTVMAGTVNRNNEDEIAQVSLVDKFVPHERYMEPTFVANDICLIKLKSAFRTNNFVAPILLPPPHQVYEGNLVASGWGSASDEDLFPKTLQKVSLEAITDQKCLELSNETKANVLVLYNMICTKGNNETSASACKGDSGGPLVRRAPDRKPVLVGITSFSLPKFGKACPETNFVTVFTEVSFFVDWIEDNMGLN